MTNKHIELVKTWLADNDSVSRDELLTNEDAARDAYAAAYAARVAAYDTDYVASEAAEAVYAAAYAAYSAARAANDADAQYAADAAYWVKRYEEVTK